MNIIGSNIVRLLETTSTNEYAASMLSNNKQLEGTIVVADFQKKGKGQSDNTWISDRGANLLFSIILCPRFLDIEKQFFLSIAISLGILKTLKRFLNADCSIKWPNDLYVGNKKICGILIQNTLGGNEIKNSIVGIGFNVNQIVFGDLSTPTSLKLEIGEDVDREDVFKWLISDLNYYYKKLKDEKYLELKSEYENNLFRYKKVSDYKLSNGQILKGQIKGINFSGQLIIESYGKELYFNNKEIVFL